MAENDSLAQHSVPFPVRSLSVKGTAVNTENAIHGATVMAAVFMKVNILQTNQGAKTYYAESLEKKESGGLQDSFRNNRLL